MSSTSQTPDQASTVVSSSEHLTFIDERPLATDPILADTALSPTAPLTAPDLTMSAEALLRNPIHVGNFNWSPTDVRNTNLFTIDLPAAFTSQDSFHRAILGIYAFLKCNLVLTFKLASTRFHSGGLWVISDPMHQMLETMPSPVLPTKFHNIWSDSSQPRAEIDASDSNPVEIPIPFVHVQDRLTTNSKETWDVMSQVTVRVASPLKTAAGTDGTITCQVFLHCSDITLDVPIYPHTATIPVFAPSPARVQMHGLESHDCSPRCEKCLQDANRNAVRPAYLASDDELAAMVAEWKQGPATPPLNDMILSLPPALPVVLTICAMHIKMPVFVPPNLLDPLRTRSDT